MWVTPAFSTASSIGLASAPVLARGFFTNQVLARRGRGNRNFGVAVVGRATVDHLDVIALNDGLPVKC